MDITTTFDHGLFLLLNGSLGTTFDNMMWILSSKLTTVPLALIALYSIYRRFGFKNMISALVIVLLIILCADQCSQFFKYNMSRLRPTHEPLLEGLVHTVGGYVGGSFGTVSAHAANSFGILVFLSMVIKNRLFTLLAILLCVAISYSRIYLGVHYPLDILYGTILGISLAYVGAKIFFFVKREINIRG